MTLEWEKITRFEEKILPVLFGLEAQGSGMWR
jgi:hypothetical protein